MYDLRQFRPMLYVLLILGLSGYALASESPGIWVSSVGLILLNGWWIKTGHFRPLPRFASNIITVLGLSYTGYETIHGLMAPILAIGNYLVLLQLVKVYEQRSNRDYAQLLVLSLLLMVAASISTASLIFGLMLIVYLFLSLYCCLLFHLKVESEHARAAFAIPLEKVNPATLRQDQRHLSNSMRRLTGLVSIFSVSTALVVFLFFPRGAGSGILGEMQFRPAETLTGFSDKVNFQQVARINQNTDIVAHVYVWKNEKPVNGTSILYLRGTVLDVYGGAGGAKAGSWQWLRSDASVEDKYYSEGTSTEAIALGKAAEGSDLWRQKIILQPTGTRILFAMSGPIQFMSKGGAELHFSDQDEVLQTDAPLTRAIEYEVVSTNRIGQGRQDAIHRRDAMHLVEELITGWWGLSQSKPASSIDPRIFQYARRPEVSGENEQGLLADQRDLLFTAHPLDEKIATNIERHLRSKFTYTLDLTDARRIQDEDPMVAFLYDFKRGHCEYFAGAMTLMCQSLGMQARMVIGFKCNEFNGMGGYYMVSQAHAHAWVEVLTVDGWKTFDPTSGRDAPMASTGMWRKARHFFDYLQHTWASSVVAYDRSNRDNLIQKLDYNMSRSAVKSSQLAGDFQTWMETGGGYIISSKILTGLIGLMVLLLVGMIFYFVYLKWRLRRRAARIGIHSLPTSDQIRLARQLGFYDDLMRLLERYGMKRASHMTPMEFCESLNYLPTEVYNVIRRMTEIFYRVRFGRIQLRPGQQRHLDSVIARLVPVLKEEEKKKGAGVRGQGSE